MCLVLRIAGARLPERLGPRLAVTIAFTMLGLGLALLAAIAEQWALWVAAVVHRRGHGVHVSVADGAHGQPHADVERPRAIASFTMFFEIGTAAGGLALGALAECSASGPRSWPPSACCVFGVWLLRTVVIPAASRDRRESVPGVAPLAAASGDCAPPPEGPVAVRFPLVVGR